MNPNKESNQPLSKLELVFPNNNQAMILETSSNTAPKDIASALDLGFFPKVIILIFGGAANSIDTSKIPPLRHLLDSVLQFAVDTDALIVDGGTKSGIMEIIGERASLLRLKPILLGVAPEGKVTYPGKSEHKKNSATTQLDPNHSHFILVKGNQWGDETETLFEVIKAFDGNIRIIAILVGGGEISKKEILLSVNNGWPVIVIEKSGFLADQIISYRNQDSRRIVDSAMKDIILYDRITSIPFDLNSDSIRQHLVVTTDYDPLLELAWRHFTLYDDSAKRLQKSFNKLQIIILTLGVIASALALSQEQYKIELNQLYPILGTLLYHILIILPISISVLVAISNRFRSGTKWVLLRAGAEAIKSEIYHYRTRSHLYRQKAGDPLSSKERFSSRLKDINDQLMKTDVSLHGFDNYDHKGRIPPQMYGAAADDDGYSTLSADQYIKIRIGDQLNYYRGRVSKLHKQLNGLYWLIIIIGGVGTFLAAVGLQLWIALSTSLAGVFLTFLEYRQVENTIIKYNQTIAELLNIYAWWTSHHREKEDQDNLDTLVERTEKVLRTELAGWIKQMEDAIEKLSAKAKEEDRSN
jgi:SLOG in TRPM, prokaryote/SMODS and SLOG-associating 2TM effector domain 1/Protein of unknown function (DUF4231)